jgi:hypothetical protein
MKYKMLSVLWIAAACSPPVYTSSSGGEVALPEPTSVEIASAYETGLPLETRMMYVDRYVQTIEDRIPKSSERPLSLLQTPLAPNAFSDVTDEQFQRMDAFYDGSTLKRIRMIPLPPEMGTEEFYYNDGKLVYVYYEPDGANKPDPHNEVAGEKFYFGAEGLLSWVLADGTRVSSSNPDFTMWSAQLLKEAERFPRGPR